MVNLLPIHDHDSGNTVLVNQAEIPRELSLSGDGDAYVLQGDRRKISNLLRGRVSVPLSAAAETR